MKQKIIIWMFVMIMLAAFVNATTNDATIYYSEDTVDLDGTTVIDVSGATQYNGTNEGATTGATGILNQALNFTGNGAGANNDGDAISFSNAITSDNTGTYCLWTQNIKTPTTNAALFACAQSNTVDYHQMRIQSTGDLQLDHGNTGTFRWHVTDTFLNKAEPMHICYGSTGSSNFLFINGTDRTTSIVFDQGSNNGDWLNDIGSTDSCSVGAVSYNNWNNGFGANGIIDEVVYYDRALSGSEIQELYNSGAGYNPYSVPTNTNLSITAKTLSWNYTINNFSATINGTTYNSNVTNGLLKTDIASDSGLLVNISLSSPYHFDTTVINHDVSSNLIAELQRNFTVLNVTAFSFNGTQINNFSINVTSLNTSDFITASTTNGIASVNLTWNETYTYLVDAENHALYNNNKTIKMDSYLKKSNITGLYLQQTIFFNFFDEDTLNPVTNVTMELVGTLFSNNYSTKPGSVLNLSLIIPDDYIVRYESPDNGYPQRRYFDFELTSRSFNNLSLYLSNSASNVSATVYDELGNKLEGAVIEVLKYDSSTGNYNLVEKGSTNFEGQAVLQIELAQEFYRFNILYNGEVKLQTDPTYIYDQQITFQITVLEEVAQDFHQVSGVDYTFVYNDASDNFKLIYSDLTSTQVSQACVVVKQSIGNQINDYNTSCSNSPSGTILVGINPSNGTTYAATAYVYIGGEEQFLEKILKVFNAFTTAGNAGLFYSVLLALMFGILGYVLGGVSASLIATPLPPLFMAIIGLNSLSMGVLIGFEAIAIIIAVYVGKNG